VSDDTSRPQNTYVVGYGREAHAVMTRRNVAADAAFLVPHLRPGMRVLDCGAGPGTITLGLAETVAPGEVIGIDISPVQVERARTLVAERDVQNVRFEVGDIHTLPFDDGTFDVAWANAVLMHLREPVAALREMRRVVRPGGIVAVRDGGAIFREPVTPLVERFRELQSRVAQATLGRSMPGLMQHKALLLGAGLTRVEGFADVTASGTPEALGHSAAVISGLLASEQMRRNAASVGFDDAALDQIAAEFDAWHERPDAMVVIVWSAGIGWVA
jgi:SAM-dependent methyltransferase